LTQPPFNRYALDAAPGESLRRVHGRRMARSLMAGLAQKRRAQFQQCRLRRTVRIVTIGAILGHRLVLPQERTAILGMTAGTGLRGGVLDQLCRSAGAVRGMAGRACHFPFQQRMMRGLREIGMLGLVAGGAYLDLCGRLFHGVFRIVHRVTTCAGDIARRVGARCPIVSRVRLMACQAFGILDGAGAAAFAPKSTMPASGPPPALTCAPPGPWQASHCSWP
jgi:energy-converting hydrogenase Eha subunit C